MKGHDLASVVGLFEETMHLPDAGIVHVVLAAVAANRLPGDPLWLLLVGPPSSGKSELLSALIQLPEVHTISVVSEAGLLSGSTSRSEGATGGLLRQLGERGLIVASDLGSLLSEHGSTRSRVLACLREVFDGRFVRRLGSDGGIALVWEGHAGFVGAVTEAVDAPSLLSLGVLGERFVYYRVPPAGPEDDHLAALMADDNAGRQRELRAQRARAVARLFASLEVPDKLPPIGDDERTRLVTLATLGARCRSQVVREGWSRDIDLVPQSERSPRLFGQLRQLHAGLAVIGTPSDTAWAVLAKTALDGIHPGRRRVIDYLLAHPGVHTTAVVAGRCGLPATTTRRHLEDLVAHGVLDFVGDKPERWSASKWLAARWPK